MEPIRIPLLISIGLNLTMFFPAYLLKTDKLTDISYALTFTIVSVYSMLVHPTPLSITGCCMVCLWALRLGTYLMIRILNMGKDKRFNTIRYNPFKFLAFWLLQGITSLIVLLPMIFLTHNKQANNLTYTAMIGCSIYLLGLLIETVADYQKYTFKRDPKHKGKWIEHGLWQYSRHPNYLGEIFVWIGIYVFAFPSLPYPYQLIGAISPIYIFLLLVFVSGIPRLERAADQKWGEKQSYQAYKRRTSVLVPFL